MPAKPVKLFSTLLIVAALIAALVIWLGREKPVDVLVKQVDVGMVQETVTNTRAGTIKACRRAGISPAIGGQIASLPVKEGDLVRQGQPLMELWNEDIMSQHDLATSEAEAAEALARQACVRAEVARRESDRQQKLRQKKLSSEEAVDRADGEARAQQAACNAARATAEVSKAKLKVIQAELDRTRLVAPFAGVVAEVNGEIGEFVTPSPVGIPTPPAVDLMDTSCLYVSAPIDEVDAPQIRPGMTARISLDAFGREFFDGRVRRVAPYVLDVEKQARTVDIEVDFLSAEDDANLLLHFNGGARGVLTASQVSMGEENALTIRVYGSEAALEWRQETPNRLVVRRSDRPLEVLTRGSGYLGDAARHATRLPPGHPEGFIEAFANLYRGAARAMRAAAESTRPDPMDMDFPRVQDGAIGVHFIHCAIESGQLGRWVDASYEPPA